MTYLRKMMLEELQRRNYSEQTMRAYVGAVERFAGYCGKPPDQLGPDEIRTYQASLFERKLSPHTVAVQVAAIRFFFHRVLQRWFPLNTVPYPKMQRRRLPKILSPEEVGQLIEAAGSLRDRAILMMLYSTGLRRAELAKLRVDDIDGQRMILHVCRGKGGKDRNIPICPRSLEILPEYWRSKRSRPLVVP